MTTVDPSALPAFGARSAMPSEMLVVVSPFAGFGRLAHLRRELLAVGSVQGVRIQGYGTGEARLAVELAPNADPRDLQLPGTRIRSLTHDTVTLAVISAVTAT